MQAALAVAVSGDEVVLLPGLHGRTGNTNLEIATAIQLTITGSGQGATIVDLENQGTSIDDRGLRCHVVLTNIAPKNTICRTDGALVLTSLRTPRPLFEAHESSFGHSTTLDRSQW